MIGAFGFRNAGHGLRSRNGIHQENLEKGGIVIEELVKIPVNPGFEGRVGDKGFGVFGKGAARLGKRGNLALKIADRIRKLARLVARKGKKMNQLFAQKGLSAELNRVEADDKGGNQGDSHKRNQQSVADGKDADTLKSNRAFQSANEG